MHDLPYSEGEFDAVFLLPFAVTNSSSFFDMSKVQFFCGPRGDQSLQIGNITLKNVGTGTIANATIAAGKTVNFRCPITNATGNLVKGTIHPTIQYQTLGIRRTFEGQDLTWFGSRWVEGDIAN
jgi:hypothetical protein